MTVRRKWTRAGDVSWIGLNSTFSSASVWIWWCEIKWIGNLPLFRRVPEIVSCTMVFQWVWELRFVFLSRKIVFLVSNLKLTINSKSVIVINYTTIYSREIYIGPLQRLFFGCDYLHWISRFFVLYNFIKRTKILMKRSCIRKCTLGAKIENFNR